MNTVTKPLRTPLRTPLRIRNLSVQAPREHTRTVALVHFSTVFITVVAAEAFVNGARNGVREGVRKGVRYDVHKRCS